MAASTYEVVRKDGTVVDTEQGFAVQATGNTYVSVPIPVREGKPAATNNGILETNGSTADEPYFVRVRYSDSPREAMASARISCSPSKAVRSNRCSSRPTPRNRSSPSAA